MTRSALPQDYIRNAGTLIEDFENAANFTASSNAVLSADTTHVRFGTYSLKIASKTVGGGSGDANKVINIKMNPKVLSYYVYLESPLPSTITLMISSSASFTKYFHYSVSGALRYGWNRIMVRSADWSNSGSESWDNTMVRLKVRIYPQTGSYANVYIDEMRIDDEARPKCLITFDDNVNSAYSQGFSYMNSKGLRGTMYVIPAQVGTAGKMTLAQLQELYDAGWALGNHSYNHNQLTTLTQSAATKEMTDAVAWLVSNGFTRGAYHGAYPGGAYDGTVISAMQDAKMLTMRSLVSVTQPTPVDDYHVIRGRMLSFNDTLATAKGAIDTAITQGGTSILVFHQIVETATLATQWSIANFRALIDYIIERGIECVTIDEWYEGLTNPRYRSLPLSRATV